ncbi:5-formyltetrahydrofolate cyclo-ligase [Roseinatronobacter thiooxidans]|uniref:5-formyltetrahydrofolate cyclo-ligase n=1 Tax=Roseinatronobacter thiooxidans TaxID=121821 RepID=A0A2W7QEL4_9RHOB|nr:5-formyltetrahydrofolate cyclo-ligase [Roseinatronobacter thiooxidans]PZX46653.1 5-formyltetrahydrofolate cyclo-ligase [Roseinatronobacter thiooxidans]
MADPVSEAKHSLRQRVSAQRAQVFHAPQAETLVRNANSRLMQFLKAHFADAPGQTVISGYMPMRSEIDPLPTMSAHSGPVCVPVIVAKAHPLEFHRWTPEGEMVAGQFKALIPAARDPLTPQAMIVPLLAFDRFGYRLGYGGGFYDRTLQGLREQGAVLAIGFAFDEQEVAEVPRDATDQRLDAIVTPSRVIAFP